MQTNTPTLRQLIAPLGFAFACVLLSVAIWISFAGSIPFAGAPYKVRVALPAATNIYQGSDVVVSGVKVGRVDAVALGRHSAVATIQLDGRYAPLHTGTTAVARTKTLLGEGYIELSLGSRAQPAIRDGGELPVSQVRPSQQLEDVLATFNPATRSNLRTLFQGFSDAVHGRAQDLNDVLATAAPTSENLASLAGIASGQGAALQQLISSSADVLSAIGQREGVLQAAITAGDRVFAATAAANGGLAATIRDLPAFLASLRRASSSLGAASGDLKNASVALEPAAADLVPGLSAIRSAAPQFTGVFARLPSVIRASRTGLPALQRIVGAADPFLRAAYPAARQLIPFLTLLSDVRDSAVAFFANVAQFANINYVGPGNLMVGSFGAVASLWNETAAGWVRKLGSNRQNAYPKPNSEADIANGGLRAYDCRNTGNPNYLPPFGSVPPCLTQGPWTFDGVGRYYPHLTESPP